jgi:uncharacterized protein (TIGR00369 family)
MAGFDPQWFATRGFGGHGSALGMRYHAHGDDWAELALPYDERLIGDPASGVIASGPIITMMDMATSLAIWIKRNAFVPHATLDLRVDYLRITRSIAFVRGQAHDGDPNDPLAHVAGTFMVVGDVAGMGLNRRIEA